MRRPVNRMKVLSLPILFVAFFAFAGCSSKRSTNPDVVGSSDEPVTSATIQAKDFFFTPREVWLKRGHRVE